MAAPSGGQEFLAISKSLLIDTINYINVTPTGAVAKGDADQLVQNLSDCKVINLGQPAAPTPPDGGGQPAPKPAKGKKKKARGKPDLKAVDSK